MARRRRRISFEDTTIEYEVRRDKRHRKTMRMVLREGRVLVTAPMRTPNWVLQAFVRDHATNILEYINDPPPEAPPKRIVSGDTLPYLGRKMRISVEQAEVRSPEVRFDHWRLRVAVPKELGDEESYRPIRDAIMAWYRERAAERLAATVELWRPRVGREEELRILIGNQRRRWGSCAYDGTLRFNWRLAMVKPALSEYVVVHELAHLTHRNHSKDFWALVSELLPDARARRRLLGKVGLGLPM